MVRDDNLLLENHEVPQRYIHIHLRHLETQIGISKMPISDDLTFQGGASSRSEVSESRGTVGFQCPAMAFFWWSFADSVRGGRNGWNFRDS